jgi:isopentenyl diphosphate isomerase/L-lactate dehydrogenase-like FMN-dependent dehydrogenase
MLNRAKRAGYTALVVTLDTYILGWRPSDMDNGYVSISIGIKLPEITRSY